MEDFYRLVALIEEENGVARQEDDYGDICYNCLKKVYGFLQSIKEDNKP